ncbi:hypothetical protein AGMMS49944_24510 [Spirochaetia bacterium]|nr:hypothetical protein AGMMS49944_24510 [Spirochaetia bacterium]
MKRAKRVLLAACIIGAALGCEQPLKNGKDGTELRIVAPETPSLIAGDTEITGMWTAVVNATAHELYYGTSPDPSGAAPLPAAQIVTEGKKVSAVITGLENDVNYYVWTRAIFEYGPSGFSNRANASPIPLPGIPGAISLDTQGDKNLSLSWMPGSRAQSYEVFYSQTGGITPPNDAAKKSTSSLNTIITGLDNGASYTLWLRAVNSAGASGFTSPAGGSPHSVGPQAPMSITVTPGSKKLNLEWPQFPGVYGYIVKYGTVNDPAAAGTLDGTVLPAGQTVRALISGLVNSPATTYYVWVYGENSAGELSAVAAEGRGIPVSKPPINYGNVTQVIGKADARFINEESGNGDRLSRKKETALGDLLCDALAWWARDQGTWGDIDFAFANGGIILSGLAKGNITAGMISGLMHNNGIGIVELSGVEVRDLFENKVAKVAHGGGGGSGTGAWGMVSKEIRYTIDYTRIPGDDTHGVLVPGSLTFKGQPIDNTRTYRIATITYLMGKMGGDDDGYAMYLMHGSNWWVTPSTINHAVIEYIYDLCYQGGSGFGSIVPETDGRVTLIGGRVH